MKRQNIWYISKYASPLKYGFASRHFSFACEFNKQGWPTLIVASDSNHTANFPEFVRKYTHEEIDGVKTIWIRTRKYGGVGGFSRILSWLDFEWKLFRLDKKSLPVPDVVVISSLSLLTVLNGWWLKRKYKCQLVFEINDIWPLTIIQVGGYSRWNPFVCILAWIERFGYKQADVIIGTMPNLGEHVQNVIGSNDKTFCIPQGIDPALYENAEPLSDEFVRQYIPQGKFVVGYAGSIGRSNALSTLVDCAVRMQSNENIHFLLIGSGEFLDGFKRVTAKCSNITFAPKIKKTQVQAFLAYCDVVYDSVMDVELYRYGLSRNKWIDYMFAAKPMIVSYGGYRSMLNEAECGVFVPPENVDALQSAILHYASLSKSELSAIGMNGKKWLLKNRTFGKLAADYLGLFV